MRVDLVDRGPLDLPSDPIRSLALALTAQQHSVRLLSTAPPEREELPGVEVLRLRPGLGSSKVAPKTIGTLIDPAAAAVVAPYEWAGSLGVSNANLVAMLPPADGARRSEAAEARWFARFLARRAARRDEALTLRRARWIAAPGEAELLAFRNAHPTLADRTVLIPPAVPDPPARPDRTESRRLLHVPDDVPVAVWFGGPGPSDGSALACDVFRRSRVFFPGARLLLVGAAASTEAGVQPYPDPSAATVLAARAAADVLLAPTPGPALPILTVMRYGVAPLLGRGVVLPRAASAKVVRRPEDDAPGTIASDLAELFADPALRRRFSAAAREYADGYSMARVAELFGSLAGASPPPNSSSR